MWLFIYLWWRLHDDAWREEKRMRILVHFHFRSLSPFNGKRDEFIAFMLFFGLKERVFRLCFICSILLKKCIGWWRGRHARTHFFSLLLESKGRKKLLPVSCACFTTTFYLITRQVGQHAKALLFPSLSIYGTKIQYSSYILPVFPFMYGHTCNDYVNIKDSNNPLSADLSRVLLSRFISSVNNTWCTKWIIMIFFFLPFLLLMCAEAKIYCTYYYYCTICSHTYYLMSSKICKYSTTPPFSSISPDVQ